MHQPIVHQFATADDLFQAAASDFHARAIRYIEKQGCFTVVLSGGNTPKRLFELLSGEYANRIPWQSIQFFFGDERYVPHDSEESNFHLANRYLFSQVPILKQNIFPISTDFSDPSVAAKAYEATIKTALHLRKDELPIFDLIYLGLGDNGHTASLMPMNNVVQDYIQHPDEKAWVKAVYLPETSAYRITLMPPVINNANNRIFLISGATKSKAIEAVLHGNHDPLHLPAQLIENTHGHTYWFLDQAAGKTWQAAIK